MIITQTNRLTLREFELTDAAFMLALLNTEGWLRFIGDRGVRNLSDAHNYLNNKLIPVYKTAGFGFYMVQLKNGTPVGICGLVKRDFLDHVDLGFAFLPEYNGQGYAYESSSAIMEYAKQTLKLNTICAFCNPDNERSIKLIEKLGMRYERDIRLPDENVICKLFSTHV